MGLFKFLWKLFKRIARLIAILLALYIVWMLYSLYRFLPRLQPIPANDEIWTSKEYIEHFGSPGKYKLVETYYTEKAVYFDEILPGLENDEEKFKERALGVYWNHMTESTYDNGTRDLSRVRVPEIGANSTAKGSVRLQVTAIAPSKLTLVEDVYTNETAYRAGLETFEIQWHKGAGAILTLKYIFHHALPPRWESIQWYTLYLQLCGRTARMDSIAAQLKRKKNVEEKERREMSEVVQKKASIGGVGKVLASSIEREIKSVSAGVSYDEL